MQRHTESSSFEIFLNPNNSGTLHLNELAYWIYTNNTNTKPSKRNYDEILFRLNLFNVEVFGKMLRYLIMIPIS